MKIRIIKSVDNQVWYKKFIGEEFEAVLSSNCTIEDKKGNVVPLYEVTERRNSKR